MSSYVQNPPDPRSLNLNIGSNELDSQQARTTTSSYHATDLVTRPILQAEYPPRTRDRDRDTSVRKEKRSSASARNSTGNIRNARLDRTPSIPVHNTVSEGSRFQILGFRVPWSSTPAPMNKAPEAPPKYLHSNAIDLEDYFLQPVEDSWFHNSVEGLKHSIDSHVYNHYGGITNPPSEDVIIGVLKLDHGDWHAPISLLSEESFRLAAIRLSITRFMLERIAFDGDPEKKFLPPDVVSLLGMASSHHTEKCEFRTGEIR